jgi:hypothetical protein
MGTLVCGVLVDISDLHIHHDCRMHVCHAPMLLHVGLESSGREAAACSAESADEILNGRYARGEIGRNEYEEKKAGISHEEERSDRQGS